MSAVKQNKALDFMKDYALYFVLLLLLVVIITKDASFLSLTNFSNVLTQSSVRIIIALGVAGLIVTQGTDLSVGRQVGLAAVISATLLQAVDNVNKVFPDLGVVPIPMVILLVCAIGALIGLVNGVIVTVMNVTPFIATLGTMLIIYGVNSLYYDYVGSAPIAGFDGAYSAFTQGFFDIGGFRLSYITIYAIVAIALMWVIWNKTRFGKNLFAIGGNPEAARVSGVNVTLNLIGIYTLSGVFYAFGGLLEAGRIGSATNNLGFMYEMDAIAACVIGGVSFSGGVGTVFGVVVGVVIFTLINYGLSYIGVNPYWQYIIKGSIIVLAVAIDSLKHAKKK
ncbi:TPA: galactose/methyl galactoside ABC transporter permease MglC [Neisseria elongata]